MRETIVEVKCGSGARLTIRISQVAAIVTSLGKPYIVLTSGRRFYLVYRDAEKIKKVWKEFYREEGLFYKGFNAALDLVKEMVEDAEDFTNSCMRDLEELKLGN